VAWDNVGIHNFSAETSFELFGFAVAWLIAAAKKIEVKSKNAQVIKPARKTGVDGWLDDESIAEKDGFAVLYKRVSSEFKTRENEEGETLWEAGLTLEHEAWAPEEEECGAGKFHACSRPYFCDEFRDKAGDRYVAIRVAVEDMYAWPNAEYPHKIAFRKGAVLYECDRFGDEIKAG